VPMGPGEPIIARRPDRSQELSEDSSATSKRRSPAVSARARCSQMIWNIAAVVGAVTSGTVVLLSLLIDESIQLRLVSALVFAAVPAVAALVLGATLVGLLRLLGIVYDLLRTLVLPRIIFCVFGMAFLIKLASAHKGDVGRVLVWGSGRRFTRGCAIGIGQILRSEVRTAIAGSGKPLRRSPREPATSSSASSMTRR
jgi:hypothetical protein